MNNEQFSTVRSFLEHNFRHFNALSLVRAARSYREQINCGNKMMITLAGAMSTAEIGISLAEMIRQNKVHAICSTGANLEEDLFNLVGHEHYLKIDEWRSLSAQQEEDLLKKGFNRVTDVAIPENEAVQKIAKPLRAIWENAQKANERKFHYQFIYELISSGALSAHYQIDPNNSWVIAASKKNLPIFCPGFEDSTLGNMFTAHVLNGRLNDMNLIKSGCEQMALLVDWYKNNRSVGFFQIGGGIAGDFPICVVPLINQDLDDVQTNVWSYFCQISDSPSSYGSYSGAFPNEKITWGKINKDTPKFIIESDATIVAPLMFAYILAP